MQHENIKIIKICNYIIILKLLLLNKFIQKLQFKLQYPNSDRQNIEDKIITIR